MSKAEPATVADQIARILNTTGSVEPVKGHKDLLAVPDGMTVVSKDDARDPFLWRTPAIGRTETVTDLKSFIAFVSSYASDRSVVFVDPERGMADAVLNYVPKPGRKPVKVNPEDETETPEIISKKIPRGQGYRFDWRARHVFAHSPAFNLITELERHPRGSRELVFALAKLSPHFAEARVRPRPDQSIARLRPRDLFESVLGLPFATADDYRGLLQAGGRLDAPMMVEFNLPIYRGTSPSQLDVLLSPTGKGGDYLSAEILDREGVIATARERAATTIKDKLSSTVSVVECRLPDLDI